ncbi:molybdopterin synthase sulfur carrier subunit [Pseudomonas fluvialis]|uniref:Molybdopterin synthase sulfur carrier subunit n=1 Tax=Pseudomonas fluvialis TaxID=1793966 RepID=A0A7X0BS45_9PSED|nr:MoaD/ThiS family protein [Pseudomonas fluvialis]MBB6340511.1 molybdopterin synthase sulfur carrier subunit [Pseudomonas fluvialis]
MIHISYFARYREHLGTIGEDIQYAPHLKTIQDLRGTLIARGGKWRVLEEKSLMNARNSELCTDSEPIFDGDQIAFFPQVTGG